MSFSSSFFIMQNQSLGGWNRVGGNEGERVNGRGDDLKYDIFDIV
jgi:hypothetical protein